VEEEVTTVAEKAVAADVASEHKAIDEKGIGSDDELKQTPTTAEVAAVAAQELTEQALRADTKQSIVDEIDLPESKQAGGPPPLPPHTEEGVAVAAAVTAETSEAAMQKSTNPHVAEQTHCEKQAKTVEVWRAPAFNPPLSHWSTGFQSLGRTELTSLYAQFSGHQEDLQTVERSSSLQCFVADCKQAISQNDSLKRENQTLRQELDQLLALGTPEDTPRGDGASMVGGATSVAFSS
jgi:hypothetical protein